MVWGMSIQKLLKNRGLKYIFMEVFIMAPMYIQIGVSIIIVIYAFSFIMSLIDDESDK